MKYPKSRPSLVKELQISYRGRASQRLGQDYARSENPVLGAIVGFSLLCKGEL